LTPWFFRSASFEQAKIWPIAPDLRTLAGTDARLVPYRPVLGAEYNLKLSQRRAEAVVDYLEKEGVSGDKLVAHGYGKTNFVATNKTREGRAQNRRVEQFPPSRQRST
jgi:outer membrane protein OmpA-like peptidoglycan-associated protein